MAVLVVCSCVLRIKDQLGNPYVSAELMFEPRRSQVNIADAVYLAKPLRNSAAPGIVVQDLLYISKSVAPVTTVSTTYTGGGVAGSEVVTVVGTAVSVQIQSGVSTATQIKTAVDALAASAALVNVVVSGTGSNTQVTAAVTNLSDDYCLLKLSETTTNNQQCIFTLNYGNGNEFYNSIIFDPIKIPNQAFQDLSSILTVSRG